MCEQEICPCRYHSTKILNDFFDIFEEEFSYEDEKNLQGIIIRAKTKDEGP